MYHHFISKQFLLFLMTGGTSVLVNFASRILYNYKFDFSTSIILAYITGMVSAYILGKCFVFKHSQQTFSRSLIYFVLVNLVGLLQTWGISLLLAYYILPRENIVDYPLAIAHAIGLIFPVFTTFLGHKYFTFRS
ncbi:MAG TPA: GtrA family protein [Legionella sp.]|nr:GtrA family protein [Legionella sp.]